MNKNDSFVRWQDISIKQLGFTTNLIFTINIAVIGFLVSKITDKGFILLCNGKALFTIGLFILILGFISGVLINLTRLYDFRLTARTARINEKDANDSELNDLRQTIKCLGKATWIIFKIQITLFVLGLVSILTSFIIMYSEKLF